MKTNVRILKKTSLMKRVNCFMQITAKIEVTQLCKNSSRTYWWDFYDVPHDDLSNPELREYYNNTANQPRGVTITFAKEAIEAGLKKLVLKVNLTDQDDGVLEDYIYVEFKTSPVVAIIKGGSEITHGQQSILTVDATSSKDPVQLYADQSFDYKWECYKIPDGDSPKLTEFMGKFKTSEQLTPSWGVCPSAPLPPEGKVQITNLEDGHFYLFIVMVEKTNRTSANMPIHRNDTAFQAVKIVPYVPPNVELR
jgi:hypothetical protein